MIVNYSYKIEAENGKRIRCEGSNDIDFERIMQIDKQAFEYGYSLNSIITFFLEHVSDDDIENMLFNIDHYTIRTDE